LLSSAANALGNGAIFAPYTSLALDEASEADPIAAKSARSPILQIYPHTSPKRLPSGNAELLGVAGAASNDVWAVGSSPSGALVEHWDGTSWKIIGSANPGTFKNALFGVSTLSDGTVAAAGFQQDEGFDAMALIMGK